VLGYDAPTVTDPKHIKGCAVVLGAHLLTTYDKASLPKDLILYNLEQMQEGSPWVKQEYMDLLKRYPVWDYSARNIEKLKSYGITNVMLCGIGYMPELTCIQPVEEDLDVVFIGSTNPRRLAVLEQLAAAGKKVTVGFDIYGKERDMLLARGKIALNLHYYDAQIFEITRVSYLLANHKCVVSETGHDKELEDPLRSGVAFAPYEDLVSTCLKLLDMPDERKRIARKGFECYSAMSLVPMLERALTILDDR
jgi:hypothetical protein